MKTIAIDFDGVIHKYSGGWKDGSIYDVPVEGAFQAIRKLMDKGYSVFIFSTRNSRQIVDWIQNYTGQLYDEPIVYLFETQKIPFWVKFWKKPNILGVTNRKLPALVYVDDRALKFDGDWKKTLKQIF